MSAGLYLLILISFILYTWVVVEDARETRIDNALTSGRTTAQFTARILDDQWGNVLMETRDLARADRITSAMAANDSIAAAAALAEAHRPKKDITALVLYRNDGTKVAAFPDSLGIGNAAGSRWYKQLRRSATPFMGRLGAGESGPTMSAESSGDQPMVVAIRIDDNRPDLGFLLAGINTEFISEWMHEAASQDGVAYLVEKDPNSRDNYSIISPIGGRDASSNITSIPAVRLALLDQVSGSLLADTGNDSRLLVGYANASNPHWSVLFVQDEAAVLEGTYNLIRRFVLVLLPLLILIFIVIMVLNRMYFVQETTMGQLAQRNTQLQQANQVRSDFLANVSHDLRTPLTTMSLALSGLMDLESPCNSASAIETIKFVSDEIDILEARVRNLLEMSRLDANAHPPRTHEVDMTDIVGAALERLQPLLQGRPLDMSFPQEPLLVICDSSQVEIVMLNLLENAIKYSEPDDGLRLAIERRQDFILFAVEDSGPGIPPGQEARIFEKFYRGGMGAKQGTGLGLAICKAIIDAHGGEIGVVNLPKTGARFWFTLPSA